MRKTKRKAYQRFASLVFLVPTAVVVLTGIVFATNSFAGDPKDSRPNIIIIETDDQDLASLDAIRPDTGEYAFPNIRWIGEDGIRFENNYVSHGLCCPSRATLLSGQYDHNHNVFTNAAPYGGYPRLDHSNTLPVWLEAAGYHTALIGKYLNGYNNFAVPAIPPGWTTWYALTSGVFNYTDFKVKTETGEVIHFSGPQNFQTDTLARRAARFIANRESGNNPFFMWLSFTNPHIAIPSVGSGNYSTAAVAPRHLGIFNGYEPVLPPSFNEADVSDKPHDVIGLPLLSPSQIEEIKREIRIRLESILSVDEGVALVKKALSRSGQLDNTIIIFTSDNGWQQGEHRIISGKDQAYEESIHMPLYMRGPGIPKGETISELIVNVDYAPTIAEIAGATPGLVTDGRSFLPLIQGQTIPWRDSFLLENLRMDNLGGNFIGVHAGGKVYVEYEYNIQPNPPGPDDVELYIDDPYQLESKHNDPTYAPIKAELRNRLNILKTCSGATCW